MTEKYESAAEAAKGIRAALKAAGIAARDVSVRSESFSMGSAIRVLVKNPDVPFETVKAIAEAKEHIDRDEPGEILGGCNRYVSVDLGGEAVSAAIEKIAALIPDDGTSVVIGGFDVCKPRNSGGEYYYATKDGERVVHCWGKEFCARQLIMKGARP